MMYGILNFFYRLAVNFDGRLVKYDVTERGELLHALTQNGNFSLCTKVMRSGYRIQDRS